MYGNKSSRLIIGAELHILGGRERERGGREGEREREWEREREREKFLGRKNEKLHFLFQGRFREGAVCVQVVSGGIAASC